MKHKLISLVLILTGSVFLILTLPGILRSYRIKTNGITTEGKVLKIEQTGRKTELKKVTVSFTTAEGRELTAAASKRWFVSQGDKVKFYYDPANPENIDFGDTIGYNMRAAIIGGFICIFGFFYLIRNILKDTANKKLILSGRKIAAEFVSVIRNEKYRMGDKNPWQIKCRWTDDRTDREYFFVSRDYIIDPAPYLAGRTHLDVFIDPDDPGKYYLDSSFMPKGDNTIG